MLNQINELYNDQAYLNALCDWLYETEGDESPRFKAAEMLAKRDAVIYCDPRANPGDEWRYDLFTKEPMYHAEWLIVAEDDINPPNTRHMSEEDKQYFTYRANNFDGWYRSAAKSPRNLFERLAKIKRPVKQN
jgi:hypothetical protein